MPVTRVIITKDGKVVIEGIGYTGRACLKDLQELLERLKLLGIIVKIEKQELKPEAVQVSTKSREEVKIG